MSLVLGYFPIDLDQTLQDPRNIQERDVWLLYRLENWFLLEKFCPLLALYPEKHDLKVVNYQSNI